MKKMMICCLTLLLSGAATCKAKDKVEASVSADIVSQYIWRGQDLGGVSVQPGLGVSFKGLSLSGWGSVGLSNPNDVREFDLTLAYMIGGFNIGITDYWFNAGEDPLARYFYYRRNATNHVFEANIGYDFGFASLQWYTNFAGNDGFNPAGKRAFSSYLEAAVPFTLGVVDWSVAVGVVPYATDFYGAEKFSVVNLSLTASVDIRITDSFSVPVFTQLAFNPCSNAVYLVFGITLQP